MITIPIYEREYELECSIDMDYNDEDDEVICLMCCTSPHQD
jgi:hypothetical protein